MILLLFIQSFIVITSAESLHTQCVTVADSVYGGLVGTLAGDSVDLEQFLGQVSVVMNTAVYNDKTSEMMTGMNTLLQKYESSGVVGLGFPCNQFNLEQPGGPGEILNAYKYLRPGNGWTPNQNFYLFSVTEVNGETTSDTYKLLKSSCPAFTENIGILDDFYWQKLVSRDITGGYEKFLVDTNGKPRYRFSPDFPMADLYPYIEELLSEAPIQQPGFPGVQ